ncbi:AgrD family cyclic lactone autoinducer peptide [Clostridium tagluense]|nr:cyclic lactone autoinducer peptide [Clostridium tagluense]MCB2299566.1 cyclic lactone autoinducer peptide [Clostridium tagluense]
MINIKIKNHIAEMLSVCAMFMAATSSALCAGWTFSEPKMPKSLYKKN